MNARGSGLYLGFDYGARRIGVALAVLPEGVATPLKTLTAKPEAHLFQELAALISAWQPQGLVLGLPADEQHPVHQEALRFGKRLVQRFARPLYGVEETLSSVAAEEHLREAGMRCWRRRKAHLDALAAALILQSFCEGAPLLALLEPDDDS